MCQMTLISETICFRWNVTCHAVLCSCTWTMHVTLCAVGLQWHKMYRKCPDHPSSSLLTTAGERIKLFTGCYFFACLVFSAHDMNVFVTDFTVDHVVTHVQEFSSGILIIFVEKLCEMWRDLDSRVAPVHGKTCRISVQNIQISAWFTVISPTMCFTWNATCDKVLCSCMWTVHITVCAVGLQWHKMCKKCPQHPSSSLLTTAGERIKLFTDCYFFAFFGLFSPWYECICDRFYCRPCCHSRAGIFKWNCDHFLLETVWDVKESGSTCGSRAR